MDDYYITYLHSGIEGRYVGQFSREDTTTHPGQKVVVWGVDLDGPIKAMVRYQCR